MKSRQSHAFSKKSYCKPVSRRTGEPQKPATVLPGVYQGFSTIDELMEGASRHAIPKPDSDCPMSYICDIIAILPAPTYFKKQVIRLKGVNYKERYDIITTLEKCFVNSIMFKNGILMIVFDSAQPDVCITDLVILYDSVSNSQIKNLNSKLCILCGGEA